jgi:hypothetical protein
MQDKLSRRTLLETRLRTGALIPLAGLNRRPVGGW